MDSQFKPSLHIINFYIQGCKGKKTLLNSKYQNKKELGSTLKMYLAFYFLFPVFKLCFNFKLILATEINAIQLQLILILLLKLPVMQYKYCLVFLSLFIEPSEKLSYIFWLHFLFCEVLHSLNDIFCVESIGLLSWSFKVLLLPVSTHYEVDVSIFHDNTLEFLTETLPLCR